MDATTSDDCRAALDNAIARQETYIDNTVEWDSDNTKQSHVNQLAYLKLLRGSFDVVEEVYSNDDLPDEPLTPLNVLKDLVKTGVAVLDSVPMSTEKMLLFGAIKNAEEVIKGLERKDTIQ